MKRGIGLFNTLKSSMSTNLKVVPEIIFLFLGTSVSFNDTLPKMIEFAYNCTYYLADDLFPG